MSQVEGIVKQVSAIVRDRMGKKGTHPIVFGTAIAASWQVCFDSIVLVQRKMMCAG